MEKENCAPSSGTHPIDTLQKVLSEIGWKPQRDEESGGFVVEFDPPYIPLSTAFTAVSIDLEQFVFFLNIGVAAPPERLDEVARFISRANLRLMIGNFEMDYTDGHVRFKSGVNFRGTKLSDTLIRNAILSAMNAVESYGDPLIEVLAGGKDADQVFNELARKAK
jgi:hypothetical protein